MKITETRLRAIIREEIESLSTPNGVELSDPRWKNPTAQDLAELRNAWPDSVFYQGRSVFEGVYGQDSNVVSNAMHFIDRTPNDAQEVYLGLDLDNDMFILGFDVWTNEGMDGVFVGLHPRTLAPLDIVAQMAGGAYARGRLQLHEIMPNVLDIRLD